MAEQRYQAVLAVISDGLSISQVASKVGVSRQTLHTWLARYEAEGLEGLTDRSHRPVSCPHQMSAEVKAALLELRRTRPYWGPRRLVFELGKRGVSPVPSESAAYRALVRAQMIDPHRRDRRSRKWKRWERAAAMELWQMDVVGGFALADGSSAKALTGVDDHSRMCVCARLMARERTRPVCDGLRAALSAYGAPMQILTDNGKVFTGRFNHSPVEVLFDAICREHGIDHILTQPRSPATTGKIERFHRSLRLEFLSNQRPFANLKVAQQALDEWVRFYNNDRPHQALKMATPASRFSSRPAVVSPPPVEGLHHERAGSDWVSRKVTTNGVVCVSWQQVSLGRHYAGSRCDVHVDGELLRFFIGDVLVKTTTRRSTGEVRNKRALDLFPVSGHQLAERLGVAVTDVLSASQLLEAESRYSDEFFYKRYMQPAEKALNLPAARFHDLRHSFAVNLLSASPPVDFKRVSKWLGHSTFTLTLDVYGDYINDDVSQPAGMARPVADRSQVVPLQRRA